MLNPASVAQSTLGQSSRARGLGAMQSRTEAPEGLTNAMDGGGMSKPTVNPQASMKYMQETQGLQQNVGTNMAQQAVGAVQQMREGMNAQSTKDYEAQRFLNTTLTNQIEDQGGGEALMKMGAITQSPAKNQFLGDLAAGASQAEALSGNPNLNSDLAQFRGEEQLEMGAGAQTARGFIGRG